MDGRKILPLSLFMPLTGLFALLFSVLVACANEPEPTPVVLATKTMPPQPTQTPPPAVTTLVPPADRSTPQSTPTFRTEQSLIQATLPNRDLNDLALRFTHPQPGDPARQVTVRNNFSLGDTDQFWVDDFNVQPPKPFLITASVTYLTDHAYWWVQEGYNLSEAELMASATKFETETYPTTRAYFGSEWSPGIDNDERIHILLGHIPGVGGYYASANEYTRLADEYSNQREIFLINLDALKPGSDHFDSVLTHEFQHMIHWNQDPNEDTWLNEGLSELAQYVNGYGLSNLTNSYLNNPDTQLTAWELEPQSTGVHYGYGFLFAAYFLDQFGQEAVTQLVAQPANGITGVERTLHDLGVPTRFDDLFADFIIANYLNDPDLNEGRWGYTLSGFNLPRPSIAIQHDTFPVERTETVHQYGVDYIEIAGNQLLSPTDLTINFSGDVTTTLLSNQAHSGRYQWYSNRGDSIDSTLTHEFDLRNLTQATLKFWAWYDIEAGWDFAYVTVSTDQGQTWQVLPATTSTSIYEDGRAYGPAFTGKSGHSSQWVEETVDLSSFAGQMIRLRFEYITDDAINHPGFAIDNIRIPELGYTDDAEIGSTGWVAEGFIRIDNILPQHFIVQIITFDAEGEVTVGRMQLDPGNQGVYSLAGMAQEIQRAILVISGQSPVTTTLAHYRYTIN